MHAVTGYILPNNFSKFPFTKWSYTNEKKPQRRKHRGMRGTGTLGNFCAKNGGHTIINSEENIPKISMTKVM